MFPLFVSFRDFGLVNTYHGLILGFVVFGIPLTTFQFAAYFKTLPREVLDAARVDGASALQSLFRVVLPMSKPILAVTGIINFVWTWNDVLLPFLVTQDSDKKPLVAQLAVITQSQFVSSSIPVLAAAAVLGFAPTVIVYVLAQRQVVRGLTAGAVK
jgi:ABC-type glycerol-3-phosphate transport system permease component